jgi:GNAT superfamily N-acetyltransferase
MAGTDPLAIVRLGPDDALAGLALSIEAHWNQNEADWRYFLGRGAVFGVRDHDGNLIASAALLPYTSGNAWISMVLVTENFRRRGLATRLVDAGLHAAAKQGLISWLDATPDGAAVYASLGFVPTLELRRLRLENPARPKAATSQSLSSYHFGEFIARDISTIGFDRSALLTELGGRPGSRLMSSGGAVALVRDGRRARHIGPLFADGPDQALALVHEIIGSETGAVLIDAVSTQDEFLDGLTSSGWIVERPFQRMRFGGATARPDELPFAVAGPEYG